MKAFIKKVSIMLLILMLVFGSYTICCFKFILPQYTNNYCASIFDKINRLESINEPKIILVGNSNLAFGIQSDLIERELKMPVVNLGFHGGAGNEFNERIAEININADDIVIVCHTDYADYSYDDTIPDGRVYWITIENHKELWGLVPTRYLPKLLKTLPNYLKNATIRYIANSGGVDDGYGRLDFNKYGDNISERKMNKIIFSESTISEPRVSDRCTQRLNKLNERVKAKGASLLVAAYPIPYGEFSPEPQKYEDFQNELEELLDFPIISSFSDYFMDYKYFYDTEHHLTNEGAYIRTKLLIDDLLKWKETVNN